MWLLDKLFYAFYCMCERNRTPYSIDSAAFAIGYYIITHVVLAYYLMVGPVLQLDLPKGASKPFVIPLALLALAGFFFRYAMGGRGERVIDVWTPVYDRRKAALAGGILFSESLVLPPVVGLCFGIAKYW